MEDPTMGALGGAPQQQQASAGDQDQQYQQASLMASKILYNEKVFENLQNTAQTDPIPALATTTVLVVQKVDEKIPGLSIDIIFGIGMAITVDAADALQQGGIEVTEEDVSEALSQAIQMYLQQNPDRFTPEEIQDGVGQLEQAIQDLPDDQQVGGQEQPGPDMGALGGQPSMEVPQ